MKTLRFIVFPLLIILLMSVSACRISSSEISLKAFVSFNNGRFYIFNEDTFIWCNVELILNYEEGDLSSGYRYKPGLILGMDYVIGSDFINSDGIRFKYWKEEPIRLMIRAETEDGRTGTFVKEW